MQWFPPGMRARAISRFYIAFPLSSSVMGFAAGALLNLQGKLGLAGWQWLFLVEGLPALVLSVVFLRFLPDTPGHANWLSAEERAWLADRIQTDAALGGQHHSVLRAMGEPRVLQLGLLFLCSLAAGYAYSFSAPAILQKLTGWSITNVGFLIAVIGLLGGLAMLLNALHSDRTGERYWHIIIPILLITAGFAVGGLSVNPWLAVPALAVTVIGQSAFQGPSLAMPASFLKGKSLAAGIGAMNTIAILGGFLGPYLMGVAKDLTGDYQRGLLMLTIPSLIGAGIMLRMWWVSGRSNSRR
jgi:ACS family tartrate transporter-like MFS transporter